MYNLKGKTAVITGGNSGVGAATAMLFAKSGANVVISARRQAALDEVASKIKAEGGNVLTVLTDISKDEDCKNLMKSTVDKFGGIDILVNNAGVLDTGLAPIDKFDDVEIQKLISINQVGTMQCIRAALEYMQEGSSIVNVASVAGVNGGGGAAYVSTKSAIIGITKHTALLLADKYIRCNAICPGFIETEMTDVLSEDVKENLLGSIPSKRMGQTKDIAETVAFLASDKAAYITGQTISVDGGMGM